MSAPAEGATTSPGAVELAPLRPLAEACASTQAPGTWHDATPPGLGLTGEDPVIQTRTQTILVDPVRPMDVYLNVSRRGTFKSSDCGQTFTKVSTGKNGESVGTGYQWYAAIDPNPNRDPRTPPTLYVTQGFGSLGLWKSTDGGASWENTWNDNVFSPDGSSNIFSDVGTDIHSVHAVAPGHLIASLHSYSGSGNNNGIFESTDGGGRWLVRKSETFSFQPHDDVLLPLGPRTWLVTAGTLSKGVYSYRTTDAGRTWSKVPPGFGRGLGRLFAVAGGTIYAATDCNDTLYKSTDGGARWSAVPGVAGKTFGVAVTKTRVYVSNGCVWDSPMIQHAPLARDSNWETMPSPPKGMKNSGWLATSTDGRHELVFLSAGVGGIWRYVEP